LDIGCGSGINGIAFLKLGASSITCTDIDEICVKTTKENFSRIFKNIGNWKVVLEDVLHPREIVNKKYDVVYSWGVLHHTGNLKKAIRNAAHYCLPEGLLVVALYRKTKLDYFWKVEKTIYVNTPRFFKRLIEIVYAVLLLSSKSLRGQHPFQFIRNYESKRGMSFWSDVRDWLGGLPYETVSSGEVKEYASELGFHLVKEFTSKDTWGVFGSGCDEFVFSKKPDYNPSATT
jgi:2-polyprenyl-6-hydroxyphenyl methylase/3-demethylubiquinone-9 3-methyltransferase